MSIRSLFLGAPGSGKGTISSRLLKRFPIGYLSSGDIIRSQISQQTSIGKQAQDYVQNGSLVPDNLMVSLILKELESKSWSNWLLDGFPRTINQAKELNKETNLNLVIELDVPQNIILDRINARWVHLKSGRIYNLDYNAPKIPFKDDITGEPLTKRDDDKPEIFEKRLKKYNEEIKPLKDYYDKQGILYTISGNTSDIIYPKLESLIIEKFKL
ncbi:unnamed protein product [Candida verbasci]|uniref:GTP:AMP phosphotransferase, mitochondrial n=1 Tax=Candida verbasci TaxID=1227364 RepID=A0A9W4U194_9ASCO|nr:unnamed protein product [Candida verbasci]